MQENIYEKPLRNILISYSRVTYNADYFPPHKSYIGIFYFFLVRDLFITNNTAGTKRIEIFYIIFFNY